MRHQPLSETKAERLFRLHRVAHSDLHRLALADPARQPDDAAVVRQDPKRDLRQSPFGAIGRDDQIAAIGNDAADSDGEAVDRGDHRLGKFGQYLTGRAVPLW